MMVIEAWFFLMVQSGLAKPVGPFSEPAACEVARAQFARTADVGRECWKGPVLVETRGRRGP